MRHTVVHLPRHAYWGLPLADDGEPPELTCGCARPDIQPLGGWWPVSFTACRRCGRPLL
jgi:hypothetical protein